MVGREPPNPAIAILFHPKEIGRVGACSLNQCFGNQ